MNKEKSSTLTYSYVDAQRLQETFFTVPEDSKPQITKKKTPLKVIITIGAIVFLSVLLLVLKYEIILLPRPQANTAVKKITASLLDKKILKSLVLINTDKRLMKKGNNSVYLTTPINDRITIKLNFKKPLDLYANTINFGIKKSNNPLTLSIIVKDGAYLSNAQNPKIIKIGKTTNAQYLEFSNFLGNKLLGNVNLSNITQIKIDLYQEKNKKELANLNAKAYAWNKNWILIKEISLSKKGD